jgi:hypothetical protein
MPSAGRAVSVPLHSNIEEILHGVPPHGLDALHVVFGVLKQLSDLAKLTIIHPVRECYEQALNFTLNQQCFRFCNQ